MHILCFQDALLLFLVNKGTVVSFRRIFFFLIPKLCYALYFIVFITENMCNTLITICTILTITLFLTDSKRIPLYI